MSVKHCKKCGKQGRCTDSRHMDDVVRRRYHCECGHSWTSAEILISEGDDRGGYKVKRYFEAMERGSLLNAIERLRAIVANELHARESPPPKVAETQYEASTY